ncbi:hypothetical protein [Nocardioides bruguierae]|uniref:Uncharacterized protein n=1 Tax=Nocardioides bruguierae TaxID=2945102 RepID=A0A9X2IFL7_9ACTN|nr:hypothetical protein [Nocardioides bruguierae]MCL8025412.1 hypothetical protein [Nocardioides bruguierae]MCM0620589.1 hypothetical protein [Nocardioides bruguierae]
MTDPDSPQPVQHDLDAPPPGAQAVARDPEAGLRVTYTFLIASMVVLGLGLVMGSAALGASVVITVLAGIVVLAGMSSARTWTIIGSSLLALAICIVMIS